MKRKFDWFYILVLMLFGVMLFVNLKFFKGSSGSAIGIAHSKDYQITSEKAARVNKVFVVAGQQVKKGDTLIKLTSNAIEIEIDKLRNRIEVMKGEQSLKTNMTGSEIAFIKAEDGVTQEEILSEIEEIRTELKLNRQLTASIDKDTIRGDAGPLEVKLKALLAQKQKHEEAMNLKISELQKENSLERTQFFNEIRLLEKELQLLIEERQKLIKFAVGDGVVENVFVKAGEELNAFTPVASIAPIHPTTVVAYLVGERHRGFEMGSEVSISGYGSGAKSYPGRIIGYGSVTELPAILQKSTAVKAFGREVYIEISPDNEFANGQKVLIR